MLILTMSLAKPHLFWLKYLLVVEMKASIQLPLLASLAASSVLPRGGYGHNGSAIGENDFVYMDGLRLYDSDGLHYLTGKNPILMSKNSTLKKPKE
jgi:hypothetical protein